LTEEVLRLYHYAADYDLDSGTFQADIPFWLEAARRCGANSVFELACGTGRVAIPLARAGVRDGYSVTGLDITPEMLERAREKLKAEEGAVQDNLKLVQGDMRSFRLADKYDLIFIPFNSVGHLLSLEDQIATFRCVREHLSDGGRFIIAVFNPDLHRLLAQSHPPQTVNLEKDVPVPHMGMRLLRYFSGAYDDHEQLTSGKFIHEKIWLGGKVEKYVNDFMMHIFFPRELRLLFMHCGYQVEEVFGNYDWSQFQKGSPMTIHVGKKA